MKAGPWRRRGGRRQNLNGHEGSGIMMEYLPHQSQKGPALHKKGHGNERRGVLSIEVDANHCRQRWEGEDRSHSSVGQAQDGIMKEQGWCWTGVRQLDENGGPSSNVDESDR
jgi:hypothetical protein